MNIGKQFVHDGEKKYNPLVEYVNLIIEPGRSACLRMGMRIRVSFLHTRRS